MNMKFLRLSRAIAALVAVAAGSWGGIGVALAQTATLTGTTTNTCTFSSATIASNGNITVSCGSTASAATISFGAPSPSSIPTGGGSSTVSAICTGTCNGIAIGLSAIPAGVTVAPTTFTFANSSGTGSVGLTVNGTAGLAAGNATITLNVTTAPVATTPAVGTPITLTIPIVDNTAAGTLQFSAASATVNENSGLYTVSVTRSGAGSAAGAASVSYQCTPSAGYAPAISPPSPGTLSWPAGDTANKSFTIDASALPGSANGTVSCILTGAGGGAAVGATSTFLLTVNKVVAVGGCSTTANVAYDFISGSRMQVILSGGQNAAVRIRGPYVGSNYNRITGVHATGTNYPGSTEVNVSTCPGDFTTVIDPAFCYSMNSGDNFRLEYWAGGGSYYGYCNLDPAKTYYLNVRFPACPGTCGVDIQKM